MDINLIRYYNKDIDSIILIRAKTIYSLCEMCRKNKAFIDLKYFFPRYTVVEYSSFACKACFSKETFMLLDFPETGIEILYDYIGIV